MKIKLNKICSIIVVFVLSLCLLCSCGQEEQNDSDPINEIIEATQAYLDYSMDKGETLQVIEDAEANLPDDVTDDTVYAIDSLCAELGYDEPDDDMISLYLEALETGDYDALYDYDDSDEEVLAVGPDIYYLNPSEIRSAFFSGLDQMNQDHDSIYYDNYYMDPHYINGADEDMENGCVVKINGYGKEDYVIGEVYWEVPLLIMKGRADYRSHLSSYKKEYKQKWNSYMHPSELRLYAAAMLGHSNEFQSVDEAVELASEMYEELASIEESGGSIVRTSGNSKYIMGLTDRNAWGERFVVFNIRSINE